MIVDSVKFEAWVRKCDERDEWMKEVCSHDNVRDRARRNLIHRKNELFYAIRESGYTQLGRLRRTRRVVNLIDRVKEALRVYELSTMPEWHREYLKSCEEAGLLVG